MPIKKPNAEVLKYLRSFAPSSTGAKKGQAPDLGYMRTIGPSKGNSTPLPAGHAEDLNPSSFVGPGKSLKEASLGTLNLATLGMGPLLASNAKRGYNAAQKLHQGDVKGALGEAGGTALDAAMLHPAVAGFAGKIGGKAMRAISDQLLEVGTLPKRYAIVTGENPGGSAADKVTNLANNKAMRKRFEDAGYRVSQGKGAYQDGTTNEVLHENPFIVHDVPERFAKLVAKEHGQNGVITQSGYHDMTTGQLFPSSGNVPTSGLPYTELPNGKRFAADIDWNNPVKSPIQALPIENGHNAEIKRLQRQMVAGSGNTPLPKVTAIDPYAAKRFAHEYEHLPKFDPKAKGSYDALNKEVDAQYKSLQDQGYKFEFVNEDPYKSSKEMAADVATNRRLKVFATPEDNFHPYMTPDQNNKFRAVHDILAHAGEGNSFSAKGEEGAYRVHMSTLSPAAQRALATETRGQNSWVNYGPNAHLPAKQRPFAEQKAALWPENMLGGYDNMPWNTAPPEPKPTLGERLSNGMDKAVDKFYGNEDFWNKATDLYLNNPVSRGIYRGFSKLALSPEEHAMEMRAMANEMPDKPSAPLPPSQPVGSKGASMRVRPDTMVVRSPFKFSTAADKMIEGQRKLEAANPIVEEPKGNGLLPNNYDYKKLGDSVTYRGIKLPDRAEQSENVLRTGFPLGRPSTYRERGAMAEYNNVMRKENGQQEGLSREKLESIANGLNVARPLREIAKQELEKLNNPVADSVVARGVGKLTREPVGEALKFKATPAEIKARVKDAWQKVAEPVPTDRPQPPGVLVDRSGIRPDEGPSTGALPVRKQFGPNAASGQLKGIGSDESNALVKAQIQRGQLMMPSTFYPSVPPWLDAVGNAGGDADMFHKASTASAIRNGVPGEIVGASALTWAMKQGITSAEEIAGASSAEAASALGLRIRDAYEAAHPNANRLQLGGMHVQSLSNMLSGKTPGAYKIPQYGAQKLGNVPGFVMDTHEARGGTLTAPYHGYFAKSGGFSNPEYGRVEQNYRGIANDLGISDRTAQEARWRGGGNITGLRTPANMDYAHIAEDLINKHARLTNRSPQDAMRRIVTGQESLFIPKDQPSLFDYE